MDLRHSSPTDAHRYRLNELEAVDVHGEHDGLLVLTRAAQQALLDAVVEQKPVGRDR